MVQDLNMETYLAPIPGDNPSGEDLRYTQVYDEIKEAKRADDKLERGEWQTDLKTSDWRLAAKLCSEALIGKSKDLQIAVWFNEALLYEKGFTGLEFGLELLSSLLTEFWDTLYPVIEDGDLDYRIGPLTYLNEKLPSAVYEVPLCDPERTKGYNFYSWEESHVVGSDNGLDKEQKEQRQQMIACGKASPEDISSAVNQSSIGFYSDLRDKITGCREKLKDLDELVTQQFSPDPPGFTQLSNALEACLRVVEKIYTEKRKSEVPDADEDGLESVDDLSENTEAWDDFASDEDNNSNLNIFSKHNAITDISNAERAMWKKVSGKAGNGHLKGALDQLMAASALAPSVRQKNRYLLLVAKLCLRAGRHDLAKPIAEELYELIETLKLEKWEHPAWIADVIETLYQCLEKEGDGQAERVAQLFQKLCTLNITRAAAHRLQV